MKTVDILLNGGIEPIRDGYYCPWQSLHFISAKVDKLLRRDFILSPQGYLDFELWRQCENIKRDWYRVSKKYKRILPVDEALHLSYYDGWTATKIHSFLRNNRKYLPWGQGFAIAEKKIPNTEFTAVSIAIFVDSRYH